MDHQPDEEDGEDLKKRPVKMGTKAAVSRIRSATGGWSRDLDVTMKELVGSRSKRVLQNMQKAVLSGSLNIARNFKVAT